MADLSITKNYSDGAALTEAHLDAANDSIETYINARNQGTAWDIVNVTNAALKVGGFQTLPILQIVTGTSTTTYSTTSDTFQTTNLTATITPKLSTSKILVFAVGSLSNSISQNSIAQLSLFRDATNLGSSAGIVQSYDSAGTGQLICPAVMFFYDSPATTSATTYSVKLRSNVSSHTVSFGMNSGTQYMVLIEVAQ